MVPLKVEVRDKKNLFIKWNDNTESVIPLTKLRARCPCATGNAFREKQSKTYIPIFNDDQVKVKSISVVGSYALSVVWKDGHSTGIYEYPFLKNLADD